MLARRRSLVEKCILFPNQLSGSPDNAKSVKFDGVNDRMQVGNNALLNPAAYSISFWFKDQPGDPVVQSTFISKVTNSSLNDGFMIYVEGTPFRLAFSSFVYNVNNVYLPYPNDQAWHHVVATASGSQVILYCDNVAAAPVASNNGYNNSALQIGCSRATVGGGSGRYTNANIDEVTFWNAVLTPADINDLYNLGKPTNPIEHARSANLVSWWRMGDDSTFPQIKDVVNGLTAQMISMAAGAIVLEVP